MARRSGRPLETGPGETRTGTRYPVRIDAAMRADVEQVEKAVAEGSATLLDARGLGFFEGREKSPQAMRAGRLPGSKHLDQAQAYDAARNGLKPLGELARVYAAVPKGEVVSFCNTGQAAATNWFVMAELLGRKDVASLRRFDVGVDAGREAPGGDGAGTMRNHLSFVMAGLCPGRPDSKCGADPPGSPGQAR